MTFGNADPRTGQEPGAVAHELGHLEGAHQHNEGCGDGDLHESNRTSDVGRSQDVRVTIVVRYGGRHEAAGPLQKGRSDGARVTHPTRSSP